jgi:hypothetical protein
MEQPGKQPEEQPEEQLEERQGELREQEIFRLPGQDHPPIMAIMEIILASVEDKGGFEIASMRNRSKLKNPRDSKGK